MQAAMPPFALGLLIGGMALFSFLLAPLAFRVLGEAQAGKLVRALFPYYYLFVIGASTLAAVALVGPAPLLSKIMLGVAALGVIARQLLMPRINAMRDHQTAGDAKAGRWFGVLHGASVVINLVQLVAAALCMALYV
jgi:hypothetical protein